MEDTRQEIVAKGLAGGGLLSKLGDLFFKGLSNVLDAAAEYEEEMGVLKQVNHISLDDGKYDLVVKLTPIKDKEGKFYVEAYTNPKTSDIDLSPINEKALDLDNANMDRFKQQIIKLIEKSGHEVDKDAEKQQNNEDSEADNDGPTEKDIKETLKIAKDLQVGWDKNWSRKKLSRPEWNQEGLHIDAEIQLDKDSWTLTAIFRLLDEDGDPVVDEDNEPIEVESAEIELFDDEWNLRNAKDIGEEFLDAVDDFKYEFDIKGTTEKEGTAIQASFVRSKGKEVSLTAISASSNILAAMDVINSIVADDEFVDSLPEGEEQSFSIVNNEDSFDIEPIDKVNTEGTIEHIRELQEGFNKVIDEIIDQVELYQLNLSEQEQSDLAPYIQGLYDMKKYPTV